MLSLVHGEAELAFAQGAEDFTCALRKAKVGVTVIDQDWCVAVCLARKILPVHPIVPFLGLLRLGAHSGIAVSFKTTCTIVKHRLDVI